MKVMQHSFTTYRTTLIAPKGQVFDVTVDQLVQDNLVSQLDAEKTSVGLGGKCLQMNTSIDYSDIPDENWVGWFDKYLVEEKS